jgi:hypothetical protein
LPILCAEFSVLPGAVRNYEVEKFPFLGRWLGLEQPVGPVRQFEQFDALFDVALVGGLMSLGVPHEATPNVPPKPCCFSTGVLWAKKPRASELHLLRPADKELSGIWSVANNWLRRRSFTW